ncbi:major facilitator superfamily domain-containing protein [Chiua virens]|nr:major facilitator superfamily domain-containing protein [Chiua virens]
MSPLDRIATDPIISIDNTVFTPSSSRPPSQLEHLPLSSEVVVPSERDPLVGVPNAKKPFYRARPLWLVPFALIASITRGMTLASRVEVFTELSCSQVYDEYRHIPIAHAQSTYVSIHPQADTSQNFTYLQFHSVSSLALSSGESEGDSVSEGDDPRVIPGKKCVSDPVVQAGAARLQTIMTSTMGALSALTTGWWGQFGERRGRIPVLAMATLGLFLTDLIFILVSTPGNPLAAHSHKLLILAPIVEGLLGGWSSLTGANSAYIADCTSPGSRATIFSRFTGVLFFGLAVGPMIGAWLIRNPIPFLKVGQADHPLQSVNSVFWVAITASFVNLLLVVFVFPESLPAARRGMNRKGKNRAIESYAIDSSTEDDHTWVVLRAVKGFLSPLAEFLPTDVPVARSARMSTQPLIRKDWSLTFLALSLFLHMLSSGVLQLKYLYAEHIYDWGAEQLSYYVSFMGGVRAFYLLAVLPFLLITFKPVRAPSLTPAQPRVNAPKLKPKPTKSLLFSDIRFDLLVVRCSMIVDFCSFALVAACPLPSDDATSTWSSQVMFVGATSLGCFGAGIVPAAQSLALSTLQGRKLAEKEQMLRLQVAERGPMDEDSSPASGKLFGAIAVLQAIGQTILGPILFGVIYSSTVASFPVAIFATGYQFICAEADEEEVRRGDQTQGRREQGPLKRIITDPIISTENTAFTPLSTHPSIERLPVASEVILPSERDPLVGVPKQKKSFYRARPLWYSSLRSRTRSELTCVQAGPICIDTSITRGMTLASSLEVITELSCRQVYEDYSHPSVPLSKLRLFVLFLFEESEGDGVDEGDDPRVIPGKKCVSNPAVQARVVKLQTIMGTIGGVLSALTYRLVGLLLRDLIYILVAYSCGMLFVGLALGPIIGAWLIRNPIPFLKVGPADHPLQSVNSVFWVAIAATFLNLLLVLFVFPESLPASRREMNRKHKHHMMQGNEVGVNTGDNRTWMVLRIIKSFFSPLATFLPADVPVARSAGIDDQPSARKDWSLTFLGFSLFVHTLSSGVFQIKYIYAEHVYEWGAEQLSYYVSFLGGIRACFLLALLPFILGTFKPVQAAVSSAGSAKPKLTKGHLFSLIRFDLLVVRCSMMIDFWSFALVAFFPLPSDDPASTWRSQAMFIGATSLGCAGAGLMPAVQSLALCTLQGRNLAAKEEIARLHGRVSPEDDAPESGNLFAAMSILQLISSSILAPIMFATIYSETIASYPKAVFAAAAILVAFAIVLTLFVRPDDRLSVLENDKGKRRSGAMLYSGVENRDHSRVTGNFQDDSSVSSYGAMMHA